MKNPGETINALIKWHLFYFLAFGSLTIIYSAWLVITPQSVRDYLVALAVVLLLLGAVIIARRGAKKPGDIKQPLYLFIGADLSLATYLVYAQRGMASRAVMLYAIPIVISALAGTRRIIYRTAAICALAYVGAVWFYNYLHPYESYLAEISGTAGFYCVIMFILAGLLGLPRGQTVPKPVAK